MRSHYKVVAIMAGAALMLSGCTSSTAETSGSNEASQVEGITINAAGAEAFTRNAPVEGGSLRFGMSAEVESLDPAVSSGGVVAFIMKSVYDALFVFDEEGNVIPELAESIETDDDGLTWTLKLPAGIRFTDGTPFNAQAVQAHALRLGAEDSKSRAASEARAIASMEVVDETTLTIVLKEKDLLFPKFFTFSATGVGSMVPSPTAVEEAGDAFGLNPVGVGPFMVESFQSGGQIVLEKNDDYRISELPYLDEAIMVPATDSQSRLSATIAGDIDLADTQDATDLVKAEEAGLVALRQQDGTFFTLAFNNSRAPFDDVRVRKAIMQAVDLDALNDAVFDGLQTPMRGLIPSGNANFKETDWPSFDQEAAKKLLEEYTSETGEAVSFEAQITSPPEYQKQAQIIQQMLDEVGVEMTIQVSDQPAMIAANMEGNFDAQLRYSAMREDVAGALNNNYRTGSSNNIFRGSNPKVDGLLAELRGTADADVRKDVIQQIQDEFSVWLPVFPLVTQQNGWYLRDSVGGFPGADPMGSDPDIRQIWISTP